MPLLQRHLLGQARTEYREVNEPDEAKVCSLLLGYCALSKAEQNAFVEGLNKFIFMSPGKRRKLIERWELECASTCDAKMP